MQRRSLASLFAMVPLLALAATAVACGGNVTVETGIGGASGTCEDGSISCNGTCVDYYNDPANCGDCGVKCNGKCSNGACIGGSCSGGLTDCGNGCVDLNTDPNNCGICNNVCSNGAVCGAGNCQISECFCGGICFINSLQSTVPQTVYGSTKGQSNQVAPTCGNTGGPDTTYFFTAPFDALYTFDTYGSQFDTVLEILDTSCNVFACNDDDGPGSASALSQYLNAGNQILVVVDALQGEGDFQLNINAGGAPGDCVSCSEVLTPGANPDNLPPCEGTSTKLYESLVSCVCVDACAFQCSDNVCAGMDITPECQNCVVDTANGCGNQFNECSNDF